MASFGLLSLPFFFTLPAPFKLALIALGGFSFLGFRAVEVKQAEVQRVEAVRPAAPAPADAAPELVAPKVKVKPAPAMVALDLNGEYTLNGEKVSPADLVKKLKELTLANPRQAVTLKADANTPVQLITNAIELCKSTGVTNVTFAAQKPIAPVDPSDSP
ncbi:hypothetical protein NT6N_32950 [Oceaniferula spumae]|uniref:Biopolymer transporter ExbD n=1 Tax=Oceaniferula spumae TaxID=2979115 RepID=A0AAT9FQP3_9BACT